MVSICFRLLQIINLKIFQIDAFSRLNSDWFQTSFRLAQRISDCVFRFQITSDCFRFILDWQPEKISDWQSENKIISDCSLTKLLKIQILYSHFRLLQTVQNWQFAGVNEAATAAADKSQETVSIFVCNKCHVVVLTTEEVFSRGIQIPCLSKKRINRVKKRSVVVNN